MNVNDVKVRLVINNLNININKVYIKNKNEIRRLFVYLLDISFSFRVELEEHRKKCV